ncbi:FGFR1 oncogene partner 2 homolog [Anthonomus grandis grandis]|uniref:FGFR1 oncogene partner 2 homolog n=1 Tax=Anthonomus grandis grandis TaxID=2921223 RepID=UPI00216679D0|nr:FGFR1 oncogene partner 2 homolog [Anthonomus grandis grandis]
MSLTMQQILIDAKKLAGRLKDRDTLTDNLLSETHAINKKIDTMKQFQEEVEQLNEIASQKPHSQLIANIQKENRHLREIQQENRDLKSTLEEYQFTIERIMTKYRQHTQEKIYKTRINFKALQEQRYQFIIQEQASKIEEMAAVMEKAAMLDEDKELRFEEIVSQLKAENQGLRELLRISQKLDLDLVSREDKTVQTEPV